MHQTKRLFDERVGIEHDQGNDRRNDGHGLDEADRNQRIRKQLALSFRLTRNSLDKAACYQTIAQSCTDSGKTHAETCTDQSCCYHNCVFHEKILLKNT